MTETTLTDAEARAEDQARVGGGPIAANDAVEQRAIGAGTIIRDRRARHGAVRRAESRGVYLDTAGKPRIVGQGQPIPDGWERLESATLADRIGEVDTNYEDGVTDGSGTSIAGRSGSGPKAPAPPSEADKRADLDKRALAAGVQDPEKFQNKAQVVEAIVTAEKR